MPAPRKRSQRGDSTPTVLLQGLLRNFSGFRESCQPTPLHRAAEIGEEQLYKEEPKARGYLRARSGYRLFENREELTRRLDEVVKGNGEWLMGTLKYPLAGRR